MEPNTEEKTEEAGPVYVVVQEKMPHGIKIAHDNDGAYYLCQEKGGEVGKYGQMQFQQGPIPEKGLNGCQIEDIVVIAIDRLTELHTELPCRENEQALTRLNNALKALNNRTKDRISRNVEGTDQA